jgi:hypothetical protein
VATSIFMASARPAWVACALVLSAALTACGGGGGGSDSPTSAAPPTQATPPPTIVPGSAALKDNAPGTAARYDNFSSRSVSVPVDQYAFSGAHVFVKVAREDGEVLFLGEVAPGMAFAVPVQVPVGATQLQYQIFSESLADQTVFGEITL